MTTTRFEIYEASDISPDFITEQAQAIVTEMSKPNIDMERIDEKCTNIRSQLFNIDRDLKRYRHQKEKESRRRI